MEDTVSLLIVEKVFLAIFSFVVVHLTKTAELWHDFLEWVYYTGKVILTTWGAARRHTKVRILRTHVYHARPGHKDGKVCSRSLWSKDYDCRWRYLSLADIWLRWDWFLGVKLKAKRRGCRFLPMGRQNEGSILKLCQYDVWDFAHVYDWVRVGPLSYLDYSIHWCWNWYGL